MSEPLYVAVDLGAGSGRVFLAGIGPGEVRLEEARRFHYPARRTAGHLRWDAAHIFAEIDAGLRRASERARQFGRPVQSMGVDSWGVNYGLVDADGHLVEDPVCYRDERTAGVPARVFDRVPREEIFARTGIQLLDFNTIFQLHAHAREGLPESARRLLLIPDLVHRRLTGRAVTEYTNATTTQLVGAETRQWDRALIERLGLPGHLLGEIVPAGTDLGPLRRDVAGELKLEGVRVVAAAPHDSRFLNPPSMTAAIADQMAATGQRAPMDPPAMARLILDSLALRYASVLRRIEALTDRDIAGVHIVGGGSQNDYLNQATADATGR